MPPPPPPTASLQVHKEQLSVEFNDSVPLPLTRGCPAEHHRRPLHSSNRRPKRSIVPTVPLSPTVPRLLILVLFLRCLLLPTDAMHLRRFRTGRLFLHRSPSTGPGCPGVPLRIRRHRPYPRQHDGLHAAVDDGTKLRPRPRRGAQHAPLLALPRQVSKGAACGGRCGFSSLRVLVRGRRWGSFQWRNLLYPRPRNGLSQGDYEAFLVLFGAGCTGLLCCVPCTLGVCCMDADGTGCCGGCDGCGAADCDICGCC